MCKGYNKGNYDEERQQLEKSPHKGAGTAGKGLKRTKLVKQI
jgi:hypothetical protein